MQIAIGVNLEGRLVELICLIKYLSLFLVGGDGGKVEFCDRSLANCPPFP